MKKSNYFSKMNFLLGKHKKKVIACCIVVSIEAIFTIAAAAFTAYYGIEVALTSKDYSLLWGYALGLALIYVIENISFYYMFMQGNVNKREICKDLSNRIFDKAMYLDMNFYNHHPSGGVINLIDSDVSDINEHIAWTLTLISRATCQVVLCALALTIINFRLGLIFWLIAPVFSVACYFLHKIVVKYTNTRREVKKKMISHINEGIMGARTIKSLNLEDKEVNKYDEYGNKYIDVTVKRAVLARTFWRFFDIAFYIALISLFLLSYKLNFGSGELIVSYSIFTLCIDKVADLTECIDDFNNEKVAIDKIYDFLNYECDVKNKDNLLITNDDLKGNIEFKDLTFTYKEGETVLNHFNLKIKSKEKVAIVGRTGSGKSTIASLLFRFYEPSEGKILLDEKDYLNFDLNYLHHQIGIILQEPLLFDDTIINNVRYGNKDASEEEVIKACKLVGADEFINKCKHKYHTKIGEEGVILSVGQKQLISFARLVLANPNIIILDEATSNIDTQTERIIQNNIENLFKDKTCIYIAHRLSTIKDVDRIIYLDKGAIVEEGSHEELMKLNGRYATLYNNQFIESNIKKLIG